MFCLFAGLSAEPHFRFHAITDVLPSLSISSITQDSRGFLWFGTQGGLVMYNGNEYRTYSSIPFAENTLSSNLVQTMMMDSEDILWIGTYAGLDHYDISTGIFTNYSIGNDVVVSILKDSKGNLWAGTLGGLGVMRKGTETFTTYRKEDSERYIADNTIRNIYEDSKGTIYASTYNGLHEYDNETDSFVPSTLLLPGNPAAEGVVYGIREDSKGDYWVVRWGTGLIKIDSSTLSFTVYPLKDNRIYNINTVFDPDLILMGTWGGGLNVFDKKTGSVTAYTQNSRPGSRLSNDIIYSQFVDKTGLLWLGTNGGGLNVYDPHHSWFSSLNATPEEQGGLPAGKINSLLEDPSGDIWISVVGKGITRYNPATEVFTNYRADPAKSGALVSNTVYNLFLDSHKNILIGTDKGLARYHPDNDSFSLVPWFLSLDLTSPQRNVSFVNEGKDGSLWIGIFDNGIVRYYPGTGKHVRYVHNPNNPQSLSDNLVYFALADSSGKTWIGTNKGLNSFDEETGIFTRYTYDKKNRSGISSNTVYSFYEHTDGTLWFGTRNGGLTSFDYATGTFSHITSEHGLPSDTIVGICPSRGDLLWAATQNGLVQVDIVKKTLSIFKTSDGLISQQFNAATATSRNGIRYFGTPVGVVYFSENDLGGTEETIPPVALTSLVINNESIRVPYSTRDEPLLELKSEQRNLTIGYSGLNFSPLARDSYSYRMDGYDEEWKHAGERKYAIYTNLNPGKYQFRVRIDGLTKGELGKETTLSFIIEKPVYARWYALLLYIFLLFLSAYLVIKIRKSLVLEKKVDELKAATSNLQSENVHLEVLSYQDSLTAIPNRRYFEYIIRGEWEAAKVRKDFLSVLMLDIDFFKQYNDTFGHVAGDEALKKVAVAIKGALFRVSDVVARYGGEEFIVVLPDTNRENAFIISERIMHAIKTCSITFDTSIGKELTLSIGSFTGIPEADLTYDKFIMKADQALYQAKHEGRNRISILT